MGDISAVDGERRNRGEPLLVLAGTNDSKGESNLCVLPWIQMAAAVAKNGIRGGCGHDSRLGQNRSPPFAEMLNDQWERDEADENREDQNREPGVRRHAPIVMDPPGYAVVRQIFTVSSIDVL
jgi:hypothetical protein